MTKYNITDIKNAFKNPHIKHLLPEKPNKVDIMQLKLEKMTYIELCGLYYIIGDILFHVANLRFRKYTIDMTIDELYNYMKTNFRLNRQPIYDKLRDEVWYNAFNEPMGNCFCCKNEIQIYNFDCGHIVSVHDNGESIIQNLLPICHTCNLDMGITNMNIYMANKL